MTAHAAGLLLAAGSGTRMGGPKALLEIDGERLVERGIRLLKDGGCEQVTVVLGAQADDVRPFCREATVVVARDWQTGMGASLRAGLAALTAAPAIDTCIVALVDQPRVQPEAVRRLLAAPGTAAVASYAGRGRNPVRLDRELWADVSAAAHGDEGARGWLRTHAELVRTVDCTDVGAPDDLDTPQDLDRYVRETIETTTPSTPLGAPP